MVEIYLIGVLLVACCIGICLFEDNCCDNCGAEIVNDTTNKEATESPMQTIEI
jgi:hypothetical protein